ncbi:MAG: hypothetical protein Q7U47_11020 [Paludibacter sp.]|nr:hypothetical protein [Paludibacter sp.]
MKKIQLLTLFVAVGLIAFTSCDPKDKEEPIVVVKASPIKSISMVSGSDTEMWDFAYHTTTKKITEIKNYWNAALDKTITYNYATAGKLTITSGTTAVTYDINASGMVTKEPWSTSGEFAVYEYDAAGYLIKISEFWGGSLRLKMAAVITNGNIMKHTTYDDDGVTVKRIKEFTYLVGDNVNEIQQASMVDHNTKPMTNLFGNSSKKLLDRLKLWDPRVNPIVERTTVITYLFDIKNRPSKITRTGATFVEVYNYTYVEDAVK